jgi:hypothetical protein
LIKIGKADESIRTNFHFLLNLVASFGLVQQSFWHRAGPDLAEPCRLADRLEKDIQQWSHVGVPANRLERLGGPVHVSLLLAPAENKSH